MFIEIATSRCSRRQHSWHSGRPKMQVVERPFTIVGGRVEPRGPNVKNALLSILLATTLATLSGSSVKAPQTPPAAPGRRFNPATIISWISLSFHPSSLSQPGESVGGGKLLQIKQKS